MNQLSTIIPLFLVLTCFDLNAQHLAKADVMSNSSSSELETNLLKQKSFDSNAVVVNGLRFEAVIPEGDWIAPPRGVNPINTSLNGSTLIPIALQITNQTQCDRRSCRVRRDAPLCVWLKLKLKQLLNTQTQRNDASACQQRILLA